MSVLIHRLPPRRRRVPEALIEQAWDRQRRRRRRWVAVTLLLVIVGITVFAINHSTSSSQATLANAGVVDTARPLPNPCTLLSKSNAAVGLGSIPASHSLSGNRDDHVCTWVSKPMGYSAMQTQFILSISRATKAEFVKSHERLAKKAPQFAPIRVHGIGTVAYRASNGYTLDVWQNGIFVSVESNHLAAYPQEANQLVRTVLKKLK